MQRVKVRRKYMPIKFDLSAFSRRRSAKFAFASLIAIVFITLVTFTARAWRNKYRSVAKPKLAAPHLSTAAHDRLHSRLARQPEAARLLRRLGKRFLAPGREVTTLIGALKIGAQHHTARITRSQADDGESLTIGLNGGPATLTWDGKDGARAGSGAANGQTLALLERIALDSPDQFILAQLRGANYYVVSHIARPSETGAADDYTGPTWKIVRVSEPENSTLADPRSSWRLYYINTATGLIDKVLSQEQGETITAELSGWTSQDGEQVPTRITWTRNKQVVMELSLNNFGHGPKQ
jgi:hypothetical protein